MGYSALSEDELEVGGGSDEVPERRGEGSGRLDVDSQSSSQLRIVVVSPEQPGGKFVGCWVRGLGGGVEGGSPAHVLNGYEAPRRSP